MGWSDPESKEKLRELVAEVLEEFEEHGEVAVERACSKHPELADALKQRIERLRRVGLLASESKAEPIPERLGDFKLLRRLGGGGMGVVYLAEQESLKRRVALKLVRPELLYFPSARDRFRREVEVVAKLNHAGIVPVYAVDAEADVPWFAMEWIEGASLDDVLRALDGKDPASLTGADLERALESATSAATPTAATAAATSSAATPAAATTAAPRSDAWRKLSAASWVELCIGLVRQAALALAHAHERGVIHRDLKPSNLMLTRDGRVRLVDFGLASTEGTTKITKSSSQLGSLPYTSPEQLAHGVAAVDARSDVYALGCVLYELLTLKPAYFEDEPERTRRRILEGQHAPIRSLNPAVNWDAETVCLTAIERDPARRYESAADFARDLERVLDFEPIAARRASVALRVKRFARRRPGVAVGAVLGALLLIGGPTIWAVQEHRYGSKLLETNRQLAAAGQKIEEQLIEEKRAREIATRSGRTARQAIIEFLGQVGDEVLNGVPRAELLRRDLLKRATKKFEEILADSGDDPDVRVELANAFRLLGTRHTELGDVTSAQAAFARGLELIDEASAIRPDHSGTRRMRADLLYEHSILLFAHVDDPAAALKDATEAAAIYRDLLAHREHEEWCRKALGNALGVAGQASCHLERYEDGIRLMQEAVAQLEDAATRAPLQRGPADALLMARNNLAAALEHADRLDEAEVVYRALLDQLAANQSATAQNVNARFAVSAASSNLGLVLARVERQEEAEPLFRDAIASYDGLARDFPSMPVYRRELARNHLYLARALEDVSGAEQEEITPLLERAGMLLEAIVASGNFDPIGTLACAEAARRLAGRRFLAGEFARGVERLQRARALVDGLRAKGIDENNADEHSKLERAFALAPPEALSFEQRLEHAERAFAAAEEFLQLRGEKGADRIVRDDLRLAFDALAKLAEEDAAIQPRVEAAARRLQSLLPDDPEAQRRASRFGAGG